MDYSPPGPDIEAVRLRCFFVDERGAGRAWLRSLVAGIMGGVLATSGFSRLRFLGAVLAAVGVGLLVVSAGAPSARADGGGYADWLEEFLIEPPVLKGRDAEAAAPLAADPANLWARTDASLQRRLEAAVSGLGLGGATSERRLSVALADVTDIDAPRVAELNGDRMMFAASLPKIAILLAAFEAADAGKITLDTPTLSKLEAMIRRSSNAAATEMMRAIGNEYIAKVLLSRRYRLYDPEHNGGLWVGKEYAQQAAWRRDPLHSVSQGATAMQTARFYYLLEAGRLIDADASRKMKEILGEPAIAHKFVRGLSQAAPDARVFRKSGTWGRYHADSALIEHCDRRYIAVALAESDHGGDWLERLIVALDDLICRA